MGHPQDASPDPSFIAPTRDLEHAYTHRQNASASCAYSLWAAREARPRRILQYRSRSFYGLHAGRAAALRPGRRHQGYRSLVFRTYVPAPRVRSFAFPDAHVLVGATPTIFENEFSLKDRVALVTGANRGIGLEMALALTEAGARTVYCVDLPKERGEEFQKVEAYVGKMEGKGRLEYVSADVTDQVRVCCSRLGFRAETDCERVSDSQETMWKIGEKIGSAEGRMDVCIAAAGILKGDMSCLDYPAERFKEVRTGYAWIHE